MLEVLEKVFLIFLIMLLVINIFAYVLFETAREPITFTDMLFKLDQVKPIDLSLNASIEIFTITADWGVFNFFKDIINSLGSVIGLAVWVCTLAINLVYFVGYCLYLLGLQSFSYYV